MSRGIGKAQRAILAALPNSGSLTVAALARQLGASQRQIRQAVHALADRELVVLELRSSDEVAGIGEYGPLRERDSVWYDWNTLDDHGDPIRRECYGPEVPTAEVRKLWIDSFDDDGKAIIVPVSIEYVHAGMPTGRSLFVWSPTAWEADQQRLARFLAAVEAEAKLR